MILISGEALIDLIPDPDKASAYDAVLGGSPYNVAVGLGRLGAPTVFVSRISDDGNGEALAAALADGRTPFACRLHFGGRPAARTNRSRGAAGGASAREREFRPQHPAIGDPG